MRKSLFISIALAALGLSAPVKADVDYNVTFGSEGTGELILDFNSIVAAENISYTSIVPYIVSLSAANVDGQSFLINTSNLADGFISTDASGQLYTLTVEEKQPSGVPAGTDFLDVYTSSWQLHDTPYDATVSSGNFQIASPSLAPPAAVPEPLTLSLFGAALVCAAAIHRHKTARQS